jgi:hypothetical protein
MRRVMGAFLLIRKPKGLDVEEVERACGDSIGNLVKRGCPLAKEL